jgi:DNA ligase D-like protein (predicted ligase)
VPKHTLPLIRPMLAVSSPPFDSSEHLFEVKWDGYRGLAYLDNNTILRSRNLTDLTAKFPELGSLHQSVNRLPAILDGEIVVLQGGKPSFAALQARGRANSSTNIPPASAAVFVVFDVLYAQGESVMHMPLIHRKELLQNMVSEDESLILSRYIHKEGRAYYEACVREGLEGVVAKGLQSPYQPGRRSSSWQKFRHTLEADLVICGFQAGAGGRALGSLILGGYRYGALIFRGKAGTGFTEQEALDLLALLKPLAVDEPVFALPNLQEKHITWVKPALVCAVSYLSLTAGGYLRHPVYKGLRRDKEPEECVL